MKAGRNTWTNIGPFLEGGSIWILRVDPATPTTLYAVSGSGIFRSVDAGLDWEMVSSGFVYPNSEFITGFAFLSAGSIFSFAIDPTDPSTMYAGTSIGLVFKSMDAGATWEPRTVSPEKIGGADLIIYDLAIDPSRPETLYAATEWGIFRSLDGGLTWALQSAAVGARLIRIDPASPSTLYAGTSEDIPCALVCAPPYGFLYRSRDAGASWEDLGSRLKRLPEPYPAISDLMFAPNSAAVFTATSEGLFASRDGGETWMQATDLPKPVVALASDPASPTLWAGTLQGLFRSDDGGTTWRPVDGISPETRVFRVATALSSRVAPPPFAPMTVYVVTAEGIEEGLERSPDGGASWTSLRPTFQIPRVDFLAADPSLPSTIYAGGSGLGVVKTTDGGRSWRRVNAGLTDLDVGRIVIAPSRPSTLYALAVSGLFRSTDGAELWSPLRGLPEGASEISGVAIDSSLSSTIYVATRTRGVLVSRDDGLTWNESNTGLPGLNVGPIGVDPSDDAILYLGTSRGPARSTDGGRTWAIIDDGWPLADYGFPAGISEFFFDPSATATIYAFSFWAGWFKTDDRGGSWRPVGCPVIRFQAAVAIDAASTLYFPSSGGGIVASSDRGASCSPISPLGLAVYDLIVDAATPATLTVTTFEGVFQITLSEGVAPGCPPPAAAGRSRIPGCVGFR